MNIQLTEDYEMTSDAYNFILNEVTIARTGKNAGKRSLRAVAFYPSIGELLDGLVDRKLRLSNTRTMEGLVREQSDLIAEIKRQFKVGINGVATVPCMECGNKEKCKKHGKTSKRE